MTFEPSGCIALGLLFAINAIQAIGDLTATTVGGMDREPTTQELRGGIAAYGVSNILTALLGGLPTATYSQNVGIVATNKVVNRNVFALTGAFLLLAGIIPKHHDRRAFRRTGCGHFPSGRGPGTVPGGGDDHLRKVPGGGGHTDGRTAQSGAAAGGKKREIVLSFDTFALLFLYPPCTLWFPFCAFFVSKMQQK